jgi:hypothetical protein
MGFAVHESAGYKNMQKTKWMTLTGSTLAVLSSSALYINIVVYMFLGERGNRFFTSPYLNYQIFGLNLDSILNDIGMLLVCGVLKKLGCSSLVKGLSKVLPACPDFMQFSPPSLMRRKEPTAKNNLPAGSGLYVKNTTICTSSSASVAPSV